MVFDAIEAAYTIVLANFATDMATLATAKAVTCETQANIIKRQSAEIYVYLRAALPAIGIWALRVATQAKGQNGRDNETTLVLDYYATGYDPRVVAVQVELAAEALMISVDKLTPGSGGVFGAGELPGAVRIELSDGYVETAQDADKQPNSDRRLYSRRAQITFPVYDRDTV